MKVPFGPFPVAVLASAFAVVPGNQRVQAAPWPAESFAEAVNLTPIEGPGTNDFHLDLSGAVWNPLTQRLWVCRNGPGGSASKFWAIRRTEEGGFAIDYQDGLRGEWTGFGDLEDLTFADLAEPVVYLVIEGQERVKAYDVSAYGTAVCLNDWDTSPYLPLSGSSGAEGIAFIPDAYLQQAGFVDAGGAPYLSQNGMQGLMFVAHQNGGRIYVFDLNRSDDTYLFIGAYKTAYTESCGLAFDRTENLLYVFHGAGYNRTEVVRLSSTAVGSERQFDSVALYNSPAAGNLEGIAVVPPNDCAGTGRNFFLAIDDGGPASLMEFQLFPCCVDGAVSDSDADGVMDCADACPDTPPGELVDAAGCPYEPSTESHQDSAAPSSEEAPERWEWWEHEVR